MVDTRTVLYAEDDEADAFLMRRAWNRVGLKSPAPHRGRRPRSVGLPLWSCAFCESCSTPDSASLVTEQAEALAVNAYWVKPSDPHGLDGMLASLRRIWLSI